MVTDAKNYCPVCGARLAERLPLPGTSLVILGALVVIVSMFVPWFRGTGFTVTFGQKYTLQWDAFSSHAFLAVCVLLATCAIVGLIVYARYRRPIDGRFREVGPALMGALIGIAALGALLAWLAMTNTPDEVALYKDPHSVAGGIVALGGFLVMACGVARLALSALIRRRATSVVSA